MNNDENSAAFQENQSLRSRFSYLELNLNDVFFPIPHDMERENRVLRSLLDWVKKYMQCPDRKKMEAAGYRFPPVDPGISPNDDWHRFESWMQGKPTRFRLKDKLPEDLNPVPSSELADEELSAALGRLMAFLDQNQMVVGLTEELPPRLLYEYLLETLEKEFDIISDGFWHLDGCSGYCPDCIQRPWCEMGNSSCWEEDKAAGEMYLPESVQRFVSASPMSLKILRKLQAEEDAKFEAFKNSDPDSDYDDDIPF